MIPQKKEEAVIEKIVKLNGEVTLRQYSKGRFLGKGGFARCYEFLSLDTRKRLAAKIVAKSSLSKPRSKQKLNSEIKIHKSLHHPHVVGFEHYFEDTENVYILLELCSNQSLNELIKRRKKLTEIEVQVYSLQILSALKYLHTHKIVHRDLKLGNLFLTDKMQVKLGDFGLAAKLEFNGEKKRTICGTPNYIAPEVLDGKIGHSKEVDIWSLGVIIYTLLVGKPPFETSDVKTTYRRIRMNAYSFPGHIHISELAKSLVTRILVTDPVKRPTLDEIASHAFFNQGYPVPKSLPTSTLACAPSASFVRQFFPEKRMAETQGVTKSCRPEEMLKTVPTPRDENHMIKDKSNLEGCTDIWVKKWVDYSSKYGLGYLLSNRAIGVFFNDSSKIVVGPNETSFVYLEKEDTQDVATSYMFSEFPKELQKKVTLLQHFRSYLEADGKQKTNIGEEKVPTVYVKKWMKTKHAILFRMSNKVVQVNFLDNTEILLNTASKLVYYVNKLGERNAFPLASALDSNNQEMTKRLKYTKDILSHMLKPAVS